MSSDDDCRPYWSNPYRPDPSRPDPYHPGPAGARAASTYAITQRDKRWTPRLLWVPLMFLPVADLLSNNTTPLRVVLGLTGFTFYMAVGWMFFRRGIAGPPPPHLLAWLVAMTADITALTLFERASWSALYPALCVVATRLPERRRLPGVLLLTALATAASSVGGPGSAIGVGASTFGVGLMVLGMRRLAETNIELHMARAELAHHAVAEERERFARDLHDLLGHSLSVIALKAELAGRLLPDRADEARTHVTELEGVARDALREVRDAVSGYRRPELAAEVEGARMALEAAGIALDVGLPEVALPTEVEAVLAWTVREGTTNVIRHSGARQCRIRAVGGGGVASVEIQDDGTGRHGDEGNGLAGLRERAAAVDGQVLAGPRSDGPGFRLQVSVPFEARSLPAVPA
jgi:two-component system sensor histidine kinase DesK